MILVFILCFPGSNYLRLVVAFQAPEGQAEAWLAVVIFEYRNVESLGVQVNPNTEHSAVSYFFHFGFNALLT